MGKTSLMRTGGAALWRQIADVLEQEIRSGELTAGDQLPPEGQLADHFEVNRHTVRQAVRQLVQQGWLRLERGKGTFVQARNVEYPIGERTRFSEILIGQGLNPSHDILDSEMRDADAETARLLKIDEGARIAGITTSGSANGIPITWSLHVFPDALCPGILGIVQDTKSITAALQTFGFDDYKRKWTRISAELPNEEMAGYLKIPVTRPVLKTVSLDVTATGQPLNLGTAWFAGDLCSLVVGETLKS